MLIRYKKTYEKIAMGLLSYMPEAQSVKALQEKIHLYETDSSSELYLMKNGEDFIGLLGIEVYEEMYILQDLAVNPSFRGEGIGTKMVNEIKNRYPEKQCRSTAVTEEFIRKCHQEEGGRVED